LAKFNILAKTNFFCENLTAHGLGKNHYTREKLHFWQNSVSLENINFDKKRFFAKSTLRHFWQQPTPFGKTQEFKQKSSFLAKKHYFRQKTTFSAKINISGKSTFLAKNNMLGKNQHFW